MAAVEGCVHFQYDDLKKATNDFDQRTVLQGGCKIGEGEFGPVYQAKLKHTAVAIKVASSETEKLVGELFDAEVRSLTKYRHPNLVVLIGYHNSPMCKALVYEYLPNGTLRDALESGLQSTGASKTYLDWMCRISIATDTALGLAYLHTANKIPLVHRNVKSANVLLDMTFRAKVVNFGLLAHTLEERGYNRTARTSGCIPPEYYHGVITTKMDTYSFGVILLEILTGLAPYDVQRHPEDLVTYLEQDMEKDIGVILCTKIDEHAEDWPSDSFLQLFRIARECVQHNLSQRPEMADVCDKLKRLMTLSAELLAERQSYEKK